MTGVMLGQGVIPVLLLTVHVMSVPSAGAGIAVGAPMAPVLTEGSTCPLGEVEVHRGGRAL
jgi:hypothetical protein